MHSVRQLSRAAALGLSRAAKRTQPLPRRHISHQLQVALSAEDIVHEVPATSSHRPHGLWLEWSNGERSFFHARWLWHNSAQYVHPGTGQRLLPPWAMPLRPSVVSTEVSEAENAQGVVSKQIQMKWMDGSTSTFDAAWLIAHDYSEKSLAHRALRSAGQVSPAAPGPLQGAVLSNVHIGELPVDQEALVDWGALHSLFPLPDGMANMDSIRCSPVPEAGRTGQLAQHDMEDCIMKHASSTSADVATLGVPTANVPHAHHGEIMSSTSALHAMLQDVNREGVVLLREVPCVEGEVGRVAERIAPVMHTIYGTLFDVKAQADPINIAYSQYALELHQDLAYYESPPGIQLLHCMQFEESIRGGDSTFIDAMHVAEELRGVCPDAFRVLATVPATFQKVHYARETPVHMVYQRPHIATASVDRMMQPLPANQYGAVTAVSWAPIFEGPLAVHPSVVEAYYDAYVAFSRLIKAREQSPNVGSASSGSFVQLRMEAGDMVVFNNRRMLHGRRAFGKMEAAEAATGRHLQGCYLNIDEYKSALSVLSAKSALSASGGNPNSALSHMEPAAHDVVLKRVGNQCMT